MITLRDYQNDAVASAFDYWREGGAGNPLIELATGTGKSLVVADLCKRIITQYPKMRLLMLVHSKELVAQNAAELLKLWPQAPVGINCAGLNRRDTSQPIIFASIQSVAKKASALGRRDLAIIDEAHLIPATGEGQYLSLLAALHKHGPVRVVGLTATPFRLDSGRLDQGDDKVFDRITHRYGLAEGVRDGYLSPLTAKAGAEGTAIPTNALSKRGGEYTGASMDGAAMPLVGPTADDIVARGADRQSWLVFGTGVDHCKALAKALTERGVTNRVVVGTTPAGERSASIAAFKAGQVRALVGVNVLLTGFNVPAVDLVAMVRPTLSPGLYVQALGRGTRLHEGKTDCLVLDYGGNVERFGPVDLVGRDGKAGAGDGRIEVKVCDECGAYRPQNAYHCSAPCPVTWPECGLRCPDCDHPNDPRHTECAMCGANMRAAVSKTCAECLVTNPTTATECIECFAPFPERDAPSHETRAASVAVMSQDVVDDWLEVDRWSAVEHHKRGDDSAPTTLRVEYEVGASFVSEWVCFNHPAGGFAHRKAGQWWTARGGDMPAPDSVLDAMERWQELDRPGTISVRREGKYDRITGYGEAAHAYVPAALPTDFATDDIPF